MIVDISAPCGAGAKKKPEFLRTRAESTMEAVEETICAKLSAVVMAREWFLVFSIGAVRKILHHFGNYLVLRASTFEQGLISLPA
ncbi:MAG: hypothetical protein ACK4S6_17825 [Roseateles asaccharophilus]|uniref:hypothetical protein n=1 Tax=Roseateles asaccharophilus TaxID=582607 RepID=UPI00391A4918